MVREKRYGYLIGFCVPISANFKSFIENSIQR